MVARLTLGLCSVVGVTLVSACGGSASGPPSSTVDRPAASPSSDAQGVRPDPCALLTAEQQHQLGINSGVSHPDTSAPGQTSCTWTNFPVTQDAEYVAKLLPHSVPGATPSAAIDNMQTAEYLPAGMDRRTHCVFLVTLGSGVTLWAQYGNPSGDVPGMTHEIACSKAQGAAADMVSTYPSLPG
jgi:hypothetical protein